MQKQCQPEMLVAIERDGRSQHGKPEERDRCSLIDPDYRRGEHVAGCDANQEQDDDDREKQRRYHFDRPDQQSTDAGRTWKHSGLDDSRHIPRVRIHPRNPDLVYAAVLGHLFGPNPMRGVYRSKDGGKTWERILFANENADTPSTPKSFSAPPRRLCGE